MESIVSIVVIAITAIFLVLSLFEGKIKKALKKKKQNQTESK